MNVVLLLGITTVILDTLCSAEITNILPYSRPDITLSFYVDIISLNRVRRDDFEVNNTKETTDKLTDLDGMRNISRSNETERHNRLIAKFKATWPLWIWREYGYFTDDYLDVINEHWLQFAPPGAAWQRTLASMYVLFCTVGGWGNIIVLLMYFK